MRKSHGWLSMTSLLLLLASSAGAQTQNGLVNRALASRADLTRLLENASQGIGPKLSTRERQMVEQRLRDGDFAAGDRVVVAISTEKPLMDTLTVRPGPMLLLPDMDPLPLQGVLRSELEEKLLAHASKYLRQPTVAAEALIRIGVLGAVSRPGYYSVRADEPLGNLLTVGGSPTGDADLNKARLSRNSIELMGRAEVRRAMASGRSLDQLGLQGGDELDIGRRGQGFGPTLAIVTGVVGLVATVVLLSRH